MKKSNGEFVLLGMFIGSSMRMIFENLMFALYMGASLVLWIDGMSITKIKKMTVNILNGKQILLWKNMANLERIEYDIEINV